MSGRLGRDPSFYTTRTGKRVAKFPLAVPRVAGKTSWHDVLAFDERADELKERAETGQLGRGNAVEVLGYWHENQKNGKDGTARTVRDLYAVAVQKQTHRNGACALGFGVTELPDLIADPAAWESRLKLIERQYPETVPAVQELRKLGRMSDKERQNRIAALTSKLSLVRFHPPTFA